MKKLLFIFATATLTMASCGGNSSNEAKTNEANIDSLATAFESSLNTAQDSAAVADLIGKANDEIKVLEEKGDTAAVKAYKWKLQELLDKNKEKLQNMGAVSAISEIANAGNAENLSKQVTGALKADAKTAKTDAEDAATSAVEKSDKVQDVKNKVEDTQKKVEETKKAVNDVKSAAQNAKDALNNLKKK